MATPAAPGTPDWWLARLYKRLLDRQTQIAAWDAWYTGTHPAPLGYEKAGPMLQRLLETIGLNMLAVVTDAALDRMQITGFRVTGRGGDTAADAVWGIWQANNFDLGSEQVRQEKMALSQAYVLVDPNGGRGPVVTAEHPSQCIVEMAGGAPPTRAAGLKVWLDELAVDGPLIKAQVYLPNEVVGYAAKTRVYTTVDRSAYTLSPRWERQADMSGPHKLGEVPLVAFRNGGRMIAEPLPEWVPALTPQRRLNKSLMDRMAMQDAGAFKAKWATGIDIPTDPATGQPVEPFNIAVNRLLTAEDPNARFGQYDAEDIQQMLAAVRDDIADCAIVVPTSPDQILGKLINVSGDGLKLAQVSEIKRVRRHIRHESEAWEDYARLSLKAAGKTVPNADRMTTQWANPEYRTDTEQANAAAVALGAGMPYEAVWERYFAASPDEVKAWAEQLARQPAPAPGNLNPAPTPAPPAPPA